MTKDDKVPSEKIKIDKQSNNPIESTKKFLIGHWHFCGSPDSGIGIKQGTISLHNPKS